MLIIIFFLWFKMNAFVVTFCFSSTVLDGHLSFYDCGVSIHDILSNFWCQYIPLCPVILIL